VRRAVSSWKLKQEEAIAEQFHQFRNGQGSDPAGAATAAVCHSCHNRKTNDMAVTVGIHVA